MFDYADPVGLDFGGDVDVSTAFRSELQHFYRTGARVLGSAFTMLEAFQATNPPNAHTNAAVEWEAYPQLAGQRDAVIDSQRLQFQDEYVEWLVSRRGAEIDSITFTSEFPEYFEAFAMVSVGKLTEAVKEVIPGANPMSEDLFGENFDAEGATPRERSKRFRDRLPSNPWNNGEKSILCLTQRNNTMGALINLLVHCSKPRTDLDPTQVCAAVGQFCGDGRSSDPRISAAVQISALGGNVLSASDPVGVTIERLRGDWSINGRQIDINTEKVNGSLVWQRSRGNRRAVLLVPAGLELNGRAVRTGAQVARELMVAAHVIQAPSESVAAQFRTGNEAQVA